MSSFALWNVSHAFLSSSPLSSSFSIANVRYDMKHPSTNSLMFGMLFLTCSSMSSSIVIFNACFAIFLFTSQVLLLSNIIITFEMIMSPQRYHPPMDFMDYGHHDHKIFNSFIKEWS